MSKRDTTVPIPYKVLKAHPHRYGSGKVHYLVNQEQLPSIDRHWYALCTGPNILEWAGIHGEEVDPMTPVTCRKCIKKMETVEADQ